MPSLATTRSSLSGRTSSEMSQKWRSTKRLTEPLKKVASFRKPNKKKDDVRDGKLFHIRVTIGYLTSLKATVVPGSESDAEHVVSAFASFAPTEEERGEYDFATSRPLTPGAVRQNVKWPKGIDVKTSKRRLYHSLILRNDDRDDTLPLAKKSFDDDSTAMLVPSPFCPELVNIYVGLKRGDETASIGMATLVLTGQPELNRKMDLPVRKIAVVPKESLERRDDTVKKTRGGITKFFGGKKKDKKDDKPMVVKVDRRKAATFAGDNTKYSFDKNAVVQVKIDVVEGVYQKNGPGLWGDLEDDEESFGPIPVIEIPEECTNELEDRYSHESIEVMPFKKGTTIISAPGNGEAVEKTSEVGGRVKLPRKGPSEIEEYLARPTANRQFFICGQESDVISEMPMTESVTEGDEEESSSDGSGDDTESEAQSQSVRDIEPNFSQFTATAPIFFDRYEEEEDYETTASRTEGDGSRTDEGSYSKAAREEAEAATNILLRYASKLGMPVDELLDAAQSDASAATSSYGGSSRGGGIPNPENALYPGDRRGISRSYSGDYTNQNSTFDYSDGTDSTSTHGLFPFRMRG